MFQELHIYLDLLLIKCRLNRHLVSWDGPVQQTTTRTRRQGFPPNRGQSQGFPPNEGQHSYYWVSVNTISHININPCTKNLRHNKSRNIFFKSDKWSNVGVIVVIDLHLEAGVRILFKDDEIREGYYSIWLVLNIVFINSYKRFWAW